ncbi:hypothetical protein [Lysobacter sp. Root604]|uniref:hypothetical protein n=1 Tax=Lysobacter sp. Root604 TaxID=1736568 RepID=UPI000A8E511D|nr:hypothetical protein [Lysobacter sp. Root604]
MKLDWEEPKGEAGNAYQATIEATSSFQRKAAPLVFTWLEWCALLALIQYVEQRTGLWPLTILKAILGLLLWGYFINFFSPRSIKWLSKSEYFSKTNIVQMVIAASATAGMVAASWWFADVFTRNPF